VPKISLVVILVFFLTFLFFRILTTGSICVVIGDSFHGRDISGR
jgi:hypothetical protein